MCAQTHMHLNSRTQTDAYTNMRYQCGNKYVNINNSAELYTRVWIFVYSCLCVVVRSGYIAKCRANTIQKPAIGLTHASIDQWSQSVIINPMPLRQQPTQNARAYTEKCTNTYTYTRSRKSQRVCQREYSHLCGQSRRAMTFELIPIMDLCKQ